MHHAPFPVGGPREPVYAFLRSCGFQMSNWSDKRWTRADGIEVHVYGTGSMALVIKDKQVLADGPLAEVVGKS
jgi:hypothetical protein